MWVVPPFYKLEHGRLGFGLSLKAAVEQFAFERREEALAQGVVETVADRAHRGTYASCLAAQARRSTCTACLDPGARSQCQAAVAIAPYQGP
jgi:hypothetical protein